MKLHSRLAETVSVNNDVKESKKYISNETVASNATLSETKNCVTNSSEMIRKRKLSDNHCDTDMLPMESVTNKKQKNQHNAKIVVDSDNTTLNSNAINGETLINEENSLPEDLRHKKLKNNKKSNLKTDDASLPCLSTSTTFVWESDPRLLPVVAARENVKDISSDEESNSECLKKRIRLTRAERYELAQKEEENIRKAEERLLDVHHAPESVDDFDRLVLASPNSSMCWIKYMAFHLQATEFEKARAVAQRALKTISFREEQEKLNVWVALLNLENLYGSKESVEKTLEEAVQSNDAWKVYIQMLQIYSDSGKLQDVDKLVSLVTKRFSSNKETWLNVGAMYMKGNQLEKARTLLQKALTRLEKKQHVEVISRFAQLENKYGSAERAQTLMEHVLTSYPKRVDVWCSYIDMLVKSSHFDLARQVLERAVAQSLPARRMKVLFKKFLQFEEQHGTPEGADRVRQMAVEYVECGSAQTEN